MSLTAEFIDTAEGRLFVVERAPLDPRGGTTLLVSPLGDEMNKSRALFTQLGISLAREGRALIVVDLFGTGDSEGNFEDASIERWSKNLDALATWSSQRGYAIDSIVAVRFGCLLAAHWARNTNRQFASTVFWQPVLNGAQIVSQWLRVRVAASMFDGNSKVTGAELESELKEGRSLEIGGYPLTSSFASELRSLDLTRLLCAGLGDLHLFEIGSGLECSPAMSRLAQTREFRQMSMIAGDAFWSATEIVQNPELIARTVDALLCRKR